METRVIIRHAIGLHARPASVFVRAAKGFAADITIQNLTGGGDAVDAKSIIKVLTLGAQQNHEILIRAAGTDADAAVKCLRTLVETNFGDA